MGGRGMCRSAVAVWQSWPVFLVRYAVRQLWVSLPGPWPVKLALLVICQLIPGQLDEYALILVTRAYRAWRAGRQLGAEVAR